jgi:hypothetical protein
MSNEARVTVTITGDVAEWMILVKKKQQTTMDHVAGTIIHAAHDLNDMQLLFDTGAVSDPNVTTKTVEPLFVVGERVIDPEGDPGLILSLFELDQGNVSVALVLKLEALNSEVDLSVVQPNDTFVWMQADLARCPLGHPPTL